jgi:hypothetical protein
MKTNCFFIVLCLLIIASCSKFIDSNNVVANNLESESVVAEVEYLDDDWRAETELMYSRNVVSEQLAACVADIDDLHRPLQIERLEQQRISLSKRNARVNKGVSLSRVP